MAYKKAKKEKSMADKKAKKEDTEKKLTLEQRVDRIEKHLKFDKLFKVPDKE